MSKELTNLLDAARTDESVNQSFIFALEGMMKTEGWKYLLESVRAQRDVRDKQLRDPLSSMDQIPLAEYMRGAAWAFDFFTTFPETLIEHHKSLVETARAEAQAIAATMAESKDESLEDDNEPS